MKRNKSHFRIRLRRGRNDVGNRGMHTSNGDVTEPRDVVYLDGEGRGGGGGEEAVVEGKDEAVVPGWVGVAAVVDPGG